MTTAYGRVTPLQMMVLFLGGETLYEGAAPPTDEERLEVMRQGRAGLRRSTGQDFGYDLGAWHRFLLDDPEHRKEYKFRYAWAAVRPKIEELLSSEDRARLVKILESTEDK